MFAKEDDSVRLIKRTVESEPWKRELEKIGWRNAVTRIVKKKPLEYSTAAFYLPFESMKSFENKLSLIIIKYPMLKIIYFQPMKINKLNI